MNVIIAGLSAAMRREVRWDAAWLRPFDSRRCPEDAAIHDFMSCTCLTISQLSMVYCQSDEATSESQFPDADGREIHAQLRRQALDVPVVLMSGSATVAASELDARTAFLAKPFDVEQLLAVAAKIA